ncbi:protein of unknown function [Acidithiobacillus ferrivorans]|uniref:Uncharacterized protein n=1 Tax=Acidithiobacillus ferrivorans TaxID=160808 RepID=A0A060UQM9_9PROT|nr:hypothetical protein AFERRI_170007 [Acidithiobacillus ferrivorans]SMH63995.1 protein of unknown function [Acidithiobacillus ferrivorans]
MCEGLHLPIENTFPGMVIAFKRLTIHKNDTPVRFNVKNVTFATNYGQNSTRGAQL